MSDNYLAAEEIQNENWQYFIQRTIEVCKSKVLIRPHEEFLLSTIENVAIAKKAYETFYNIIEKNLYLTIKKFSVDEKEKIQKDFQNKYFAGEDSLTNLDSWIEFYYHFGRFPGSDHFTNVPHAEMPYYLKTTMPLSPMKLHTSFRGTDAKGLASLHALAALNIYFGRSQDVSKIALGEYLKSLTYQALSNENDNIYLLLMGRH